MTVSLGCRKQGVGTPRLVRLHPNLSCARGPRVHGRICCSQGVASGRKCRACTGDRTDGGCAGVGHRLSFTVLFLCFYCDLLSASCSLQFLRPHRSTAAIERVVDAVRAKVPFIETDVYMAPYMNEVWEIVRDGGILRAVDLSSVPSVLFTSEVLSASSIARSSGLYCYGKFLNLCTHFYEAQRSFCECCFSPFCPSPCIPTPSPKFNFATTGSVFSRYAALYWCIVCIQMIVNVHGVAAPKGSSSFLMRSVSSLASVSSADEAGVDDIELTPAGM